MTVRDLARDVLLRLRALVVRRRVDRELDEELAFHLERETQKHVDAGLSPADARARALARFGPIPLAADGCRDARGISLVDDLARDIFYAFRTFRRARLAALTIVATVALGLGLVAVVFTIYNLLFLRVDAVRSPEELFAVELRRPTGTGTHPKLPLARPDYEAMRRETSTFTDIAATLDPGPAQSKGRLAQPVLVTGNFFQMLGVEAALGRPLLPEDDDRSGGRRVLVLSHAGWRKLFQRDPDVIGRRLQIGDTPYDIVGVMPDGFRGLGLTPPDYWAPLALTMQSPGAATGQTSPAREERSSLALAVIGRLKPELSREAAAASLSAWASGRPEFKVPAGRPIQVSLTPRQGTVPSDDLAVNLIFSPLFFAFGLILLIGCANVANLLLARGVSRQREIGIRLSLGASRRRIIRQLLTESLLLSLAAAACGIIVARLFLEGLLHAVSSSLPPQVVQFLSLLDVAAQTSHWRVLMFLVAGGVVSTMCFGLVPALQATRVDLLSTMRGEVTRGGRPRGPRHALIVLQVGAAALLLICAGIFLRGAVSAATKDSAVRTSDTVRVSIPNESRRAALLQALATDPLVAEIVASSRSTDGVVSLSEPATATAPPARPKSLRVGQQAVSSGFFDLLGFPIVRGRSFRPTERTAEAGVAIVSETIARQLWADGDGVGQRIRLDAPDASAPSPSRTFTVIGITRDPARVSGTYLNTFRGIYLPTDLESPNPWLLLRVRANPEQASQMLLERLATIDPGLTNVMTLQMIVGMQTYMLQLAFYATLALGALALVLTVSGLFSVLSYLVEQQTKEIGVRMALGAATHNVVRLILFQSVRPVGFGLAAGGSLAAAVAILLMTTPDAAEIADVVDVFDPGAYAASLLIIVISCALAVCVPALRAARIDPIATLRKD